MSLVNVERALRTKGFTSAPLTRASCVAVALDSVVPQADARALLLRWSMFRMDGSVVRAAEFADGASTSSVIVGDAASERRFARSLVMTDGSVPDLVRVPVTGRFIATASKQQR